MSDLLTRLKRRHECATSLIFPTVEEVEAWYRERGETVSGYQAGVK